MKKVLYLLLVVTVVLIGYWIFSWVQSLPDHGSVLIGINSWSIEISFVMFVVTMLIAFCLFYLFFRVLGWLLKMPGSIKVRGKNIKFNRSQEALIAGLVDSAEGNWEKAEKILIKHVSHSGAPLIHYLTAARAAQSRGALAKRDEYLRQAANHSPSSEIAVGLTQAELHLSENQFHQAVETLSRLHSINPTHATVLKLLHQAYKKVGDWEGLRNLLPTLNEQKVLMEADVKLLETEVYSEKLKDAAGTANVGSIQEVWATVPAHIKSMPGVVAVYFAAMIDAGSGQMIESDLVNALSNRWNATLLSLYSNLQAQDIDQQLVIAERWLAAHPNDTQLLNLLGRLNLKLGDLQKSEQYLRKSIAQEPTVQALQLLGDALFKEGEKDKAADVYKQGLTLAASQLDRYVGMIAE
ncbi:MAG: tetratricopeptide repeat protein [Methylococcaceae bacterium]|nr:tetratricopeptide repeat protein [Methylococcaceae bacterium]